MDFAELDRQDEVREALMRVTGLPFDHEGYLLSLSQYTENHAEGLRLLQKEKDAITNGIRNTMHELDMIGNNPARQAKATRHIMTSVYRQLNANKDLIEEVSYRLAGGY